ncbi:MAG TPA: threonine synthase [Rubricoccaceae bacterium]|jgi:threonine synthase
MRYRSTSDPAHRATFREAVLSGTPPGGGLYVPETPPALPPGVAHTLADRSIEDIAFDLARAFIGPDDVSDADLADAVRHTLAFPLPVVDVEPGLSLLELFHGPTLAFKDVGARFLAAMLGLFASTDGRETVVLVATSGDTGGAVAAGLHGTPDVSVVVLYPGGRVSPLQEKQFASLGGNVHALRVAGSFDDCQRLVKAMFADPDLREGIALTSANSISVARLVPQTFYYGALARHTAQTGGLAPAVVVPSGNVGNLTAGLLARRAGLPLGRFVAATNANTLLSDVLGGMPYAPRASHQTLSTAMDVGDPSNLARLLDLYGSAATLATDVEAVSVSDAETEAAMRGLSERTGYVADPHTAVGVAAWERVQRRDARSGEAECGVVLATAHPAKFPDEVHRVLGSAPQTPERLARLATRPLLADDIAPDTEALRAWLMARFGAS